MKLSTEPLLITRFRKGGVYLHSTLYLHGMHRDTLYFTLTEFTLVVKKKLFLHPVKIQGDSYSFDIAESEYDNQIALSIPVLREEGLYSEITFVMKYYYVGF
jgi:hypothetical protein